MLRHLSHNIRQQNTRFFLVALLLMVGLRFFAHITNIGWQFAALMAFGMTGIYAAFAYITHDRFLKLTLLMTVVAGFTELAADKWLIESTRTLVYYPDEPFIVDSPLYMPFAWAMILTNIGYLGYLISLREDRWKTIVLTMLLGGTIIPLFEHWAKGANWWWYRNTPMIGYVPYYIILGEAIICAGLAWSLHQLKDTCYPKLTALVLGIGSGLWIWLSYFIAYWLIG
jgi:hypothetical protein